MSDTIRVRFPCPFGGYKFYGEAIPISLAKLKELRAKYLAECAGQFADEVNPWKLGRRIIEDAKLGLDPVALATAIAALTHPRIIVGDQNYSQLEELNDRPAYREEE